jgi:type II secretory pathway pseudopilin PulG
MTPPGSPALKKDKVILAITLIVMIAGVVLVQISASPHHGAISKSSVEIASLGAALEAFKADHGYYPENLVTDYAKPTNNAVLVTALMPTNGDKVYFTFNLGTIVNGSFIDPFGSPYGYACSNGSSLHNVTNGYDLWSTRGGSTNPSQWINNW